MEIFSGNALLFPHFCFDCPFLDIESRLEHYFFSGAGLEIEDKLETMNYES